MTTVTIRFRAKRDVFQALRDGQLITGEGYKVPSLTTSHVSVSERDALGTFLMQDVARGRDRAARAILSRYAGLDLPSHVLTSDTDWTITPVGKGFMADVSITRPLTRGQVQS